MTGALTNHLWQSTLFAIAVALLSVAFRKNRAAVRYGLWFTASLKFFIPFSLLMSLGSYVRWTPVATRVAAPAISFTMVQVTEPFPNTLPALPANTRTSMDWVPLAIVGLWVCGFAAIALMRTRGWRRIRAVVRSSAPIDIPATVDVRYSPGLLEPGVVGWFRPILLLPEGILEHLTPPQFEAVLAHELCHIRRRDNLTAAIHMVVEAVFWFHPLVWWIGARMLEERERACDEAVLSLGSEPHDYAQGILNICKSYVESPLACVPGVTGANLKKRIRAILTGIAPGGLTLSRKLVLAAAGMAALAAPVVVGIISAAHIRAQSQPEMVRFEKASITPCETSGSDHGELVPGTFHSRCTTVERFIQQAYGLYANGHENLLSSVTVTGGPAWTHSGRYQIDAQAGGNQSQVMMNGPMLQALLEDRFKLKVHRETRDIPVYKLTVATSGSKLQPFQGTCIPWDPSNYYHPPPPDVRCARGGFSSDGADLNAASMADLCVFFLVTLDRPVIDKTGLAGRFDFHLQMSNEDVKDLRHGARGVPALRDPSATATDPSLVSAIKTAVNKLGLNLTPATSPGESVVIDSVQRPTGN